MTHCNGINAEAAIQLYESLLKSLGVPLEFTQTRAYVPSFQVSICHVLMYESLLRSLGVPLEFTQTRAYVPSFQVSICRVLIYESLLNITLACRWSSRRHGHTCLPFRLAYAAC
jgi:hypothetical protein